MGTRRRRRPTNWWRRRARGCSDERRAGQLPGSCAMAAAGRSAHAAGAGPPPTWRGSAGPCAAGRAGGARDPHSGPLRRAGARTLARLGRRRGGRAWARTAPGRGTAVNETIDADVCVIGAGAGGAVVAAELAEGGARVVVLEQGPHHDPGDFTARPPEMLARLYRDGGQTTTLGTPPILLPLGRGLGGTTLINSGSCFRTPPPV